MTGFKASLVGSNPREGNFFILFQIIHIYVHHIPVPKKRILTSIMKTFKNDKGSRDNKQKRKEQGRDERNENTVGVSSMSE